MNNAIPTQAQIVIIGGGIVGCSTAYHLTRQGYTDVVLLERKELGSGTTWAAAGLVAQLRQNQEMTNLAKYATELYTPLESGLGFVVCYDKGDFAGKAALTAQKENGLTRKLVQFTLDDPEVKLYANEPIYRDGVQVSQITSGAYGFKVGSAVGMGYLTNPDGITNDWIEAGKYEVMVEGQLIGATVHLRAPYDPKGQRTKM